MDENAPAPKKKNNLKFLLALSAVFLSASASDKPREVFLALFGDTIRGIGFSVAEKDYVFKSGEAISVFSVNHPDLLIKGIFYRWESDSVNLKIIFRCIW